MVKETVVQVPYEQFLDPETTREIKAVQQAEEKKLKRSNRGFITAGFLALLGGGALLFNQVVGFFKFGGFFETIAGNMTGIAIAGGVAVGWGLLKLWRKVFVKKKLNFPNLTIKRKSHEQPTVLEETFKQKRIAKSGNNKVFLGVAGGLAEYAGISPSLMRLLFIVVFFFSMGISTLLYLALGIFLPDSLKSRSRKKIPKRQYRGRQLPPQPPVR